MWKTHNYPYFPLH